MPIFQCEKCGTVDNTATTRFWLKGEGPALCSECDPKIRKWHGLFEKSPASGLLLGEDGFLYVNPPDYTKIIKIIA